MSSQLLADARLWFQRKADEMRRRVLNWREMTGVHRLSGRRLVIISTFAVPDDDASQFLLFRSHSSAFGRLSKNNWQYNNDKNDENNLISCLLSGRSIGSFNGCFFKKVALFESFFTLIVPPPKNRVDKIAGCQPVSSMTGQVHCAVASSTLDDSSSPFKTPPVILPLTKLSGFVQSTSSQSI